MVLIVFVVIYLLFGAALATHLIRKNRQRNALAKRGGILITIGAVFFMAIAWPIILKILHGQKD